MGGGSGQSQKLAVLRTGGRGDTPESVLHGNFRLPCAILLKAEQLEENPAAPGAVEQREVDAGELVDS
jgi:hypothetical protein